MGAHYFRPSRKSAVGSFSSREWKQPFIFADGRVYDLEDVWVDLFEEEDSWKHSYFLRYSCAHFSVIEKTEQCYFDFEFNFWPNHFDDGYVQFQDVETHFSIAQEAIRNYLATAHPQRGRSEYNWPIQIDYQPPRTKLLQEDKDAMRVIFLDFDGVLNNVAAHQTRASMNQKYKIRVAKECVQPLQWLLHETGAQIVLSTSHRTDDVEMWTECLHEIGIPSARVIGSTPDLTRWPNNPSGTLTRGHEIDAWLDEAKQCCSTVNYVILDDCDDMAMHQSHLVQTDLHSGLTMTEARRAAKMLMN